MKKLYNFYFDKKWTKWSFLNVLRIVFAIITLPLTIFSFFVPLKGVQNRFLYGFLGHVFVYIFGTMVVVVIDNEFGLRLAEDLPPFNRFALVYAVSFMICGIFYYIDKNLIKFFNGE